MRGVLSGSHLDGEAGCSSLKWLCWHEAPGNETEKSPSLSSATGETEAILLCLTQMVNHITSGIQRPASLPDGSLWKLNKQMRDGLKCALIDLTGCLKTVQSSDNHLSLDNHWMGLWIWAAHPNMLYLSYQCYIN